MVENFHPNFTATGIGALPHDDPGQAVDDVLQRLTEMPYWPQLPGLSPLEDMNLQYARALAPLVAPNPERREATAFGGLDREEALAGVYGGHRAGPPESFGLQDAEAAGFAPFMQAVQAAQADAFPWVKGHVTGPLTLAASVMGPDGKALLYDDEAAQALAQGLGAAAAAQAHQLAPLGRRIMIFLDEPFLSGYGSAFTPVNRETVVGLLSAAMAEVRQRCPEPPVIGVHCCGNTDWSLLVESGADVLNLDSAGYGEHLLLYPQPVKELLERGGAVAWGAAPTSEYKGDETAEGLWADLKSLLVQLEAKGVDREMLASQALVTPACGMGSLSKEQAVAILDLTAGISRLARAEFS